MGDIPSENLGANFLIVLSGKQRLDALNELAAGGRIGGALGQGEGLPLGQETGGHRVEEPSRGRAHKALEP
jgi:hypothetical protein